MKADIATNPVHIGFLGAPGIVLVADGGAHLVEQARCGRGSCPLSGVLIWLITSLFQSQVIENMDILSIMRGVIHHRRRNKAPF